MEVVATSDAIKNGKIYELHLSDGPKNRTYGYIRYTDKQRLLIVLNFDRELNVAANIIIPDEVLKIKTPGPIRELLTGKMLDVQPGRSTIPVIVPECSAMIIEF